MRALVTAHSRREHDLKCLVRPFPSSSGLQQLRQLPPDRLTKFVMGIQFCSPMQQVFGTYAELHILHSYPQSLVCQGAGVAVPGVWPLLFPRPGYKGQLNWLADVAVCMGKDADSALLARGE